VAILQLPLAQSLERLTTWPVIIWRETVLMRVSTTNLKAVSRSLWRNPLLLSISTANAVLKGEILFAVMVL
jgi:hypothetical protein